MNNPLETRCNPHPLFDSPKSRTAGGNNFRSVVKNGNRSRTILSKFSFDNPQKVCEYRNRDRDMNFLNANSDTQFGGNAVVAVVCEGTEAAVAAAEGDTMSSEGWGA